MKVLALLFFLTGSMHSFASLTSMMLEEKIEKSLQDKISGVIAKELFVIDSTVYLSENKTKNNIKSNNDENESILLKKFDLPLPQYMQTESFKSSSEQIEKISIIILVDESVSEENFQAAKKITELVPIKFSNKTAAISFVRGKVLIKPAIVENQKNFFEENQAMLSFLTSLFGPLSIVIIGLVIGFVLFRITSSILKTFQMIKEQEMALQSSSNTQERAPEITNDTTLAKESFETTALDNAITSNDFQGYEKFHALLQTDKDTATSLLKRLMSEKSEKSQKILTYLTLGLNNEELISLRSKLADKERMLLNRSLTETVIRHDEKSSIDSLASQFIVREMMAPSWFDDKEIKEILDSTSNEVIAESIKINTQLGGVILNLLPSLRVALIMEKLEEEETKKIMEEAKSFDALKAKDYAGLIRDAFGGEQTKSILPFLEGIHIAIPNANQDTEALIFDTLLKNLPLHEVHKVAMQYYPSHLVEKLPAPVLKKALDSLADKRVSFFLSLEETKRETYLSAYGDAENKAREIINIEIEETNDIQKAKAKRLSAALWSEFMLRLRALIQKDSESSFIAEEIIDDWVAQKAA